MKTGKDPKEQSIFRDVLEQGALQVRVNQLGSCSDSAGLGWVRDPAFVISYARAYAAGPQTTLWTAKIYNKMYGNMVLILWQ